MLLLAIFSLIVPELCGEFLSRYGPKMEERGMDRVVLNDIGASRTYRQMVMNLLLPLLKSGGGRVAGGDGRGDKTSER